MKKLVVFVLLAAAVAPITGCIVAPVGPRPYAASHWVRGHYGPYGGWHPGHWA